MRADVRDDDGQLASGPPIEVPVEVLSVGEVRFPECVPSSCDNGLAILARQARRRCSSRRVHTDPRIAAVSASGHLGAAKLFGPTVCLKCTATHSTPAHRCFVVSLVVKTGGPCPTPPGALGPPVPWLSLALAYDIGY